MGNYKTIVYNTVIDNGSGQKSHNDRGDIALEIIDYCAEDLIGCVEVIIDNENLNIDECQLAGYVWKETSVDDIVPDAGPQWLLDHEFGLVYLFLADGSNPNNVADGIGLAFPWSIRPKLKSRNQSTGGFFFDLYNYGNDLEEWTSDDDYIYYGATFAESWFFQDSPFGSPTVKSDWQASTESRYNSHNLVNTAGDLFGNTELLDISSNNNNFSVLYDRESGIFINILKNIQEK